MVVTTPVTEVEGAGLKLARCIFFEARFKDCVVVSTSLDFPPDSIYFPNSDEKQNNNILIMFRRHRFAFAHFGTGIKRPSWKNTCLS